MEFSQCVMFTLVAFVCSGLHLAYGLQCYECSSNDLEAKDCDMIPTGSTKYLKNCSEGAVTCRIQQQWVDFTVLNQTTDKRTIRQCATTPFDPERPCYYRAGFGGKVNVCHCNEDSCNEAPNHIASLAAITLSLLLTFKVLN